eukprot:CAMPEP_0181168588 /NCGR_PEP_ID=MMETSP1096-20121128/356_1 /TAXON_ID=156174 ORGANISM="Chrysochromulina ericina, Strain CCMP281" /NCGR_SAMPLE_ID=MMETSP1096 /ASSEMBLY_ACC=CAM_ASM_000453 /LENGTH=81 /DNA_ID=CAMNT_0023255979 /DNA_START=605 /DNA_END=850 /DNA_ORIENTATION=-
MAIIAHGRSEIAGNETRDAGIAKDGLQLRDRYVLASTISLGSRESCKTLRFQHIYVEAPVVYPGKAICVETLVYRAKSLVA